MYIIGFLSKKECKIFSLVFLIENAYYILQEHLKMNS